VWNVSYQRRPSSLSCAGGTAAIFALAAALVAHRVNLSFAHR